MKNMNPTISDLTFWKDGRKINKNFTFDDYKNDIKFLSNNGFLK